MAMPQRKHTDLFAQIASFNPLLIAAKKAVKGKRKKPGAASFFANLERELLRLERELRDGTYRPGRYVEILVHDPKERLVSAAPFRDRVVHHALCAMIVPLFEPSFIGNTFANRAGKGTHRAIVAYERHRDHHSHVLRADIFRYFPSIDHAILKAEFRRPLACEQTLWLMDLIVDYLTYVFIPAYALFKSGMLSGWMGWFAIIIITYGSVVYFADTRMKTKDKSFSGFPACWNMVVLVLFAVQPSQWASLIIVAALTAGMFLNLKFIHPTRTKRWNWISMPMSLIWVLAAA
jgi:hypothetical protein